MKKSLKPLFLSTTLVLALVSNPAFATEVLDAAKDELAPVAPAAVTNAEPGWFDWMFKGRNNPAIQANADITVEIKEEAAVTPAPAPSPAPVVAPEEVMPKAPKKVLYELPDDAPVTDSVMFLPTQVVEKGWLFSTTKTVEKKYKVKKPVEDISASELQGAENLALLAQVETLIPDEEELTPKEVVASPKDAPAQDTPVDVQQPLPESPVASLSEASESDREEVRPLFDSADEKPVNFKEYSSTPSASDEEDEYEEDEYNEYNYDVDNYYDPDATQGSAAMELDSGHEGMGFSLTASGDGLFGGEGITDSKLIETVLLKSSDKVKENWDDPDFDLSDQDELFGKLFEESPKPATLFNVGASKKAAAPLSTSPKAEACGSVINEIKERHQSLELMQRAKNGTLLAPVADKAKKKRTPLLDLFDIE